MQKWRGKFEKEKTLEPTFHMLCVTVTEGGGSFYHIVGKDGESLVEKNKTQSNM